MHLVGFAMEIYYDARPCERQIRDLFHSGLFILMFGLLLA